MQRTHNRHALHLNTAWSADNYSRLQLLVVLVAAVVLAPFALQALDHTANTPALVFADGQSVQPSLVQGPAANSASITKSDDVAFERGARQLAEAGSSEAYVQLVQDLNQSENVSHRAIVLQLLKDAPPDVDPVLIAALNDPDAGVRAGAAQALGLRQNAQAISALATATRDSRAWVRSEAAQSLGEIQAWQELPRLNQLQVSDPNPTVYTSAKASAAAIRARLAAEIGLLANQLVDVSVTPSEQPRVYAVTQDNLYVRDGDGTNWRSVGPVPDNPIALATGTDGNSIYLTTVHLGLYRSLDGGITWQHLQFGSNTPRPVIVTALAASSLLSGRLYAALATPGSKPGELNPLDLVVSSDGGNSWLSLPDAPLKTVTTHLYVDPQTPGYLVGLGDDTPWRYPLPGEVCDGCPTWLPGQATAN